jgi:hypothetical protein
MPREIKNDMPSAAQLSDLIRPIVKSEVRRSGGALAGALSAMAGQGLSYDSGTNLLNIELTSPSGLEFVGASPAGTLRVDLNTSVITMTASGLETPNFSYVANDLTITASDAILTSCVDFLATASNNCEFFAVNGDIAFTTASGNVQFVTELNWEVATNNGDISISSNNTMTLTAGIVTLSDGASDIVVSGGVYIQSNTGGVVQIQVDTVNVFDMSSSANFIRGTITGGSDFTIRGGSGGSSAGQTVSVEGGQPTSGANVNAGGVDLKTGQPRGTGTAKLRLRVTDNAGTTATRLEADLNGLGFFGNTPIARPGTYTLTAGTPAATTKALSASGNNGAAFTGIDNAQVGTPYAQLTDLNTLRTEVLNLAAVLRALIRDAGDGNGLGLVDETGY